jgi:hypothetical protein
MNLHAACGFRFILLHTIYNDEYGVAQNNWNRNDFWQVQGSNTNANVQATLDTHDHSTYWRRLRLNRYRRSWRLGRDAGITGTEVDNIADFNTSFYISNGEINDCGNTTFSPFIINNCTKPYGLLGRSIG